MLEGAIPLSAIDEGIRSALGNKFIQKLIILIIVVVPVSYTHLGHNDLEFSSVYFGSSDAAAFSQAGITATCLAAMDPKPADYYHNRRDTAERLVPEAIKTGFDVIISTILNFCLLYTSPLGLLNELSLSFYRFEIC